jgi:tetratricopeptide (TPR) repeat protein
MKIFAPLLAAFLAAGCATTAPPPSVVALFDDAAFARASEPIDPGDVFAVSDAMRRFVSEEIAPRAREKGARRALFDALYSASQLRLDYDSGITRNAAQAFADRSGNCLSLVIMTAALAREMGLDVRFQKVVGEEAWTRQGEMHVANGHVNVALVRDRNDLNAHADERQLLTIDFVPPKEKALPRKLWALTETTVTAMYFNNRAVETLAAGKVDDAYWWARAAIQHDAAYLIAYNTLGVVYKKKGDFARAERVLQELLAREPRNLNAMTNLVLVYKDLGRERDAQALRERIAALQPTPPFHWFDLGMEAMQAGDFRTAKAMFAARWSAIPTITSSTSGWRPRCSGWAKPRRRASMSRSRPSTA